MNSTTNNTTIDINAITAALEDLGWNVSVDGDTIEIETHSGLDEDLVETLDKSNPAGSMEDIAFDFDPEDHAGEWYTNRDKTAGVPQSLRALLEDADGIAELYDKTAARLREVQGR